MFNTLCKKIFMAVLSCMLLMNSSFSQQEQATMEKETQPWLQVKVVYLDFEGGFYGLVTEKGNKFLPMNLAKEYKVVDTVLNIKGHKVEGMVTTKQWGTLYKLVNVKLIQLGKKQAPNTY